MRKPKPRAMLEADFIEASERGEIECLETVQTGDESRVLINRRALPAEQFYLAARRKTDAPKVFKDMTRMMRHLRSMFKGPIKSTYEDPPKPKKKRATRKPS